jgi:hypothetical protein
MKRELIVITSDVRDLEALSPKAAELAGWATVLFFLAAAFTNPNEKSGKKKLG